jgi:hypothetical protein
MKVPVRDHGRLQAGSYEKLVEGASRRSAPARDGCCMKVPMRDCGRLQAGSCEKLVEGASRRSAPARDADAESICKEP